MTNMPRNMRPEKRLVCQGDYLQISKIDGKEIAELAHSSSDSVVIFCLIRDLMQVVFIEQARPAMSCLGNPKGIIQELPAGRFDCEIGIEGLVVKELSEEAGITIRPDQIEIMNGGKPMALSAGIIPEKSWITYVEVNSNQVDMTREEFGLKEEGEEIRRILVPLDEVLNMDEFDVIQAAYAVHWFIAHKLAAIRKADADNAITD